MCLITNKRLDIRTAERGFTTYKTLFQDTDGGLWSPYRFRDFKYNKGTEATSPLSEMTEAPSHTGTWIDKYRPWYESGRGLYSYTDRKSARTLKRELEAENEGRSYVVCRCTVPKGAKYITDRDIVVSDRLILKRKCIL